MNRIIKYRIVSLLAIILMVTSCMEREEHTLSNEVKLSVSMPFIQTKGTSSSTSGIKDIDTNESLEIALARIDQNYSGTPDFPAFTNCGTPLIATLGIPDTGNGYIREVSFTSQPQFFRNSLDAISYASWYPSNGTYSSTSSATTVSFTVDGQTDVMYGSTTSASKSTDFDLIRFNHALCIYNIYVYAMLSPDAADPNETRDRWGALRTMELHNMPTTCTIRLPLADGTTYDVSYSGTGIVDIDNPSNNIFYDPGDILPLGIANRRLVAKCIAAPPTSGVLDIALTTSTNTSAAQSISIARNFKPGCAYDIILRFSDHGFINADVSVSEWTTFPESINKDAGIDMYYNLSTYGTANCYMINSGNYGYSFTGSVMGNGNGASVGVSNAAINPGYIDILWTDMPAVSLDITDDDINNPVSMQTVALVANELSQGKVLLKVYGNQSDQNDKALLAEGNVIIAAYTDNTKSQILWTWHLWLSDKIKTHGYSNGYSVQDRNLGAIANAVDGSDYSKMHGLYYQWGRPTPFENPTKGHYVLQRNGSATTPQNAVANPTTLFGTSNTSTNDWYTTGLSYAKNLWGWKSDSEDPEKTIYDPCPHGYIVSDYRMWKNMSDNEKQGTYTFNYSTGGVNVSIASNNIWYPFQGCLDVDGTVKTSPHPFYMWSNSVNSSNDPYYFIYDREGESNIAADGHANIAAPVRCISTNVVSVVENLSETQTANCYLVHKEGYYKFKANIRGNGVGSLFPLGGNHDAVIMGDLTSVNISPAKVDVLWWQGDISSNLTGTITDPQNYMCVEMLNNGAPDAEGYVTFKVNNFYKGNVILAAYDSRNVILWSWHIWLTDVPETIATGKYSLMDRFLGATFAPTISPGNPGSISFANNNQRLATYGFYYQWGRKDPIPGPPSVSGTSTTTTSSTWWKKTNNSWTASTTVTAAAAATIANVVKAPMNFYKSGTSDPGTATSGWFPASFADGYVNPVLWGYAVSDWQIQGQTFTKTMHDPCPPGYRTPFHYAWDGEINGVYSGVDYRYIAATEGAGNINLTHNEAGFDSAGQGIVLNKTTFENAWYPFTGWRAPDTGICTNVGSQGRMYTGMPMGEFDTRYYNYNGTVTGQRQTGINCGTAYGFAVRCQKE